MKVNRLGTLAIIGVVVSFTVACGGSPTKPTAVNPLLGEGASTASVNVSNLNAVGAVDQICTGQPQTLKPQTLDDGTDQTGGEPTADTPPVTCNPSGAADQPQGGVVGSDSAPMDSARFVHRLHR
jgi:hypothetical protein